MVEVFSIFKDISLAGAACTTAYVAFTGLEKWQKELRGKASFEVARELIKSVYKLRDEIKYCRSPFTLASEFPEEYYKESRGERSAENEGQGWAHVYANRWLPVGEALQVFDTAVLEAEALWGTSIKDESLVLRKCVRTMQVDIEAFIQNKYSGGESFKDLKFAKDVEEGVWDINSDENELSIGITKAIEDIEAEIRPHLSRS
jgi:hypothetical protein